MWLKTPLHICFNHPEHGSDQIAADFKNLRAANGHLKILQTDPVSIGAVEWLKDATLWVVDDDGKLV